MEPRRLLAGLLLASWAKDTLAADVFTTNAICKRNNCINPIFPGMEDLSRLEGASFACSSLREVAEHMHFCRGAVMYDPALPLATAADEGDGSVQSMVMRQDHAASTMFVYHLAGLGMEAWDYTKPEDTDNDCVKSIWRMVCYTYFPRAKLGCQVGLPTQYTRPCQSSCHNYIRQCGVECCDESVACVFEHKKAISPSQSLITSGYVPHDGPSSLCTGGARRMQAPGGIFALVMLMQAMSWFGVGGETSPATTRSGTRGSGARGTSLRRRLFQLAAPLSLVAMSVSLQGCDTDVPTHAVGNWRAQPDYLLEFEFVPPGAPAEFATLNSCSIDKLSPTLQCNGRGVCKLWDETNLHEKSAAFCECSRDWADPECRTRRKSQVLAYMLSVFGGIFGADQFYLGFWYSGVAKLSTLGGLGIWWIYDIIRIGSAPVQTTSFRLAGDLPHWVFVLLTVNFALLIGFAISWVTATQHMMRRRKDVLLLQAEEEARALGLNNKPERHELRRAGADPGDKIPNVQVAQSVANPFYGSMNQMGQAPVSPASSMGYGELNRRAPAKPGPMAYSMPQSMGGVGFNPTPPGTIPPPSTLPPGGYGTTMYGAPTTPMFATGQHAEEAL